MTTIYCGDFEYSDALLGERPCQTSRRPPASNCPMAQTKTQKTVPIVFISSTSEDLKEHRAAARDAANSAGFLPVMMEYFVASGEKPPLDACLAKVDETDVLVAIVAHRYG